MTPNPILTQAAITLALYNFRPYILETRNLVLGLLSETNEKYFLKEYFFSYHEQQEKAWNDRHQKTLEEVWQRTHDPRAVLQAEVVCLDEEMRALPPEGKKYLGNIKLKVDDLSFAQKRFLEIFFLRNSPSTCQRDELTQKISQATDYDLIVENLTHMGMNGPKVGRSPLEPFAEAITAFYIARTKEILPVDEKNLLPYDRIKALDSTQRKLFFMNALSTALSSLMHVASIINKIRNEALQITLVDEETFKPINPSELSLQFLDFEGQAPTILASHAHSADLSNSSEVAIIAEAFFTTEVPILRTSLSNLRLLLDISLEKDFSEKEKACAQKIQAAAKPRSLKSGTSSGSQSPATTPRSLKSGTGSEAVGPSSLSDAASRIHSAPVATTKTTSEMPKPVRTNSTPALASLASRFVRVLTFSSDSTTPSNPVLSPKEETRAHEYLRIDGYSKMFSTTIRVLDLLEQFPHKTSAPNSPKKSNSDTRK